MATTRELELWDALKKARERITGCNCGGLACEKCIDTATVDALIRDIDRLLWEAP